MELPVLPNAFAPSVRACSSEVEAGVRAERRLAPAALKCKLSSSVVFVAPVTNLLRFLSRRTAESLNERKYDSLLGIPEVHAILMSKMYPSFVTLQEAFRCFLFINRIFES